MHNSSTVQKKSKVTGNEECKWCVTPFWTWSANVFRVTTASHPCGVNGHLTVAKSHLSQCLSKSLYSYTPLKKTIRLSRIDHLNYITNLRYAFPQNFTYHSQSGQKGWVIFTVTTYSSENACWVTRELFQKWEECVLWANSYNSPMLSLTKTLEIWSCECNVKNKRCTHYCILWIS